MAIKYILENEISEGRTIVDSVDKVHFRSGEVLNFKYNSETGLNNLIEIDLLKSNYFILDLTQFSNPTTYIESIHVRFLNVGNTQRFEILLRTNSLIRYMFIWDSNFDVVFPWGETPSPLSFSSEVYKQNIITFRKGLVVNNIIQFVGMQTPWIII